ncbi:MAG: hypothetical protein LBG28_07435, partial [Tannerella sp.]|nr:hypothetical protein [Tannerella sp.]
MGISFDNGRSYRTAAWNTPLSYTFASGGEKTIYFKLTYFDGSACVSRTRIYVNDNAALRASAASLTDEKIPLNAGSAHSGGILEIRYATKNTSKKLQKPLIIAEPFDMSSVLSVFPEYTLDKILERPDIQAVRAMIDSLQYDIVYVNYNNGLDDIFRNAALFREAIRYVNQQKDKSINHPNLVLGISMGGLVARYALRSMELAGEDHDTWKFISMDSPHKGANLPLGLQGLIRDIEGFSISIFGFIDVLKASDIIPILDELYGVLNAKATRQMLIYYCDKNMNIDNSEHENFQKEYDRVGFPLKCQNIAVSSGSAVGNTLFVPGTRLFTWNPSQNFNWLESYGVGFASLVASLVTYATVGDVSPFGIGLLNLLPGNSAVKADFYVDALPDKKVAKVFDGHIYFRKWILGFICVTTNISHKDLYSKDYMLPLDGAAGSFNSFIGIEDNDENFKEIIGGFKKKKITFIPTSSSLALSNWQDLVNKDIRNRDFYAEGLSEFEYSFYTNTSYKHGDFAFAVTFLGQHLATPPISFDLASSGFSTSTQIPLKNPLNVPVSWSVSNSNFSLLNTGNTSATLFCDKPNQTGIITVSNTVNIPPATASAFGINSSFQMQQRKRMKTLDALRINGDFEQGSSTAILQIPNLQAGIPVSWSLSDNSNFRIVSSAADSAVVEALSYNKKTTVTATVNLANRQVVVSKDLTSPALSVFVPELDCRETEAYFRPLLSAYESVEWTVDDSRYVRIISGANMPTVKIKGLANTSYVNLNAKVKAKGEEFTASKKVTVAIPESFDLEVVCINKKDSPKQVLVRAKLSPNNPNAGAFHWRATNGFINPCVEIAKGDFSAVDFTRLLVAEEIS